jgi:hypothetical protein
LAAIRVGVNNAVKRILGENLTEIPEEPLSFDDAAQRIGFIFAPETNIGLESVRIATSVWLLEQLLKRPPTLKELTECLGKADLAGDAQTVDMSLTFLRQNGVVTTPTGTTNVQLSDFLHA